MVGAEELRLQKIIAQSSTLSRRTAEQAILAGRVKVNHEVVTALGTKANFQDRIELDGRLLQRQTDSSTFILHKPRRTVTTRKDPEGRKTVIDLLPEGFHHLYPVGRLDFLSTGLLLLTNQGELAQRLTHPKYQIQKIYRVVVQRPTQRSDISKLMSGIRLEDGIGRFERVRAIRPRELEVTISEGRNRFVRRMFESLDHSVQRLHRIKIGPIRLGELPAGASRPLTQSELEELNRALNIQ